MKTSTLVLLFIVVELRDVKIHSDGLKEFYSLSDTEGASSLIHALFFWLDRILKMLRGLVQSKYFR